MHWRYLKLKVVQLMSTNKVKLNPGKTVFLIIGNERQWSKFLSMFPIELFSVKTNPAKSAWNLGVIFHKNFTFRSHVSAVSSSCFYHMRDLRLIHRHLDLDGAKSLATALESGHLDCCNSLSCMISRTLTSPNFNVFRIDWPTL